LLCLYKGCSAKIQIQCCFSFCWVQTMDKRDFIKVNIDEIEYTVDVCDIDNKLNLIFKAALQHCFPKRDKLEISIDWNKNTTRQTVCLLWSYRPFFPDIDICKDGWYNRVLKFADTLNETYCKVHCDPFHGEALGGQALIKIIS